MGKQKAGSFRTTISIPQDLKRRMDKAGPDVNWSAIAATAFEAKLAEIAAKKVKKNMDDVIQRLRASKTSSENELYQEGFEVGQQWAKEDAEAIELKRLQNLRDHLAMAWEGCFDPASQQTYNASQWVVFAIRPETDKDRHAAEEFWGDVLVDEFPKAEEDQFVRGFAEGALEVWAEVSPHL